MEISLTHHIVGDIDEWMLQHNFIQRSVSCIILSALTAIDASVQLGYATGRSIAGAVILSTSGELWKSIAEQVAYSFLLLYSSLVMPAIALNCMRYGDIMWSGPNPARRALHQQMTNHTIDVSKETALIRTLPPGTEKQERYRDILLMQYDIEDVVGDGNCGLRAIARSLNPQLTWKEENSEIARLRKGIVDHMRANRHYYENFIEGDFDRYLQRMAQNGEWIGNQELRALSDAYGYTIEVFSCSAPTVDWMGRLAPSNHERFGGNILGKTARIYYANHHYQTVSPKNAL